MNRRSLAAMIAIALLLAGCAGDGDGRTEVDAGSGETTIAPAKHGASATTEPETRVAAIEELRAFRQAHPERELDEELAALLSEADAER